MKAWLIGGAILMGCLLSGYLVNSHWQIKWAVRDLADKTAEATRAKDNQAKEHQDAVDLALINKQHQADLEKVKKDANDIIAQYRNGTIKLRKQFDCASRGVSQTSPALSVRDAATDCGLSSGDVEFLVRFAERANATNKQLIAAQGVIRKYYESINGEKLP